LRLPHQDAELLHRAIDAAFDENVNGPIGDDVHKLMEHRSFALESEEEGQAEYSRHDGDIWLTVYFKDGKVDRTEAVLSGNDKDRFGKSNRITRRGWEGLHSFTNSYGD
jgi:hypothetical protein